MAYRICSISGGGVRGIIPATIIKEMLTISKNNNGTGTIKDLCDYVVGTSAGGIIGAGLTVSEDGQTPKFDPDTALNILRNHASEIFPENSNILQQTIISLVVGSASGLFTFFLGVSLPLVGAIGFGVGALTFSQSSYFDGLFFPKYSREGIDSLLEANFGNLTLTDVIVPFTTLSYSLEKKSPRFWSTFKAQDTTEHNFFIKDALGATSAAPTYFPHKVTEIILEKGKRKLYHDIDGGIFDNSPVGSGISVLEKYATEGILSKVKKEGIVVLSLGTGRHEDLRGFTPPTYFQEGKLWYGLINPLVLEAMAADEKESVMQARNLFHAIRVNPVLDESLMPMDKSGLEHINRLSEAANAFIKKHEEEIKCYVGCLVNASEERTLTTGCCKEITKEGQPGHSYEDLGFMSPI